MYHSNGTKVYWASKGEPDLLVATCDDMGKASVSAQYHNKADKANTAHRYSQSSKLHSLADSYCSWVLVR